GGALAPRGRARGGAPARGPPERSPGGRATPSGTTARSAGAASSAAASLPGLRACTASGLSVPEGRAPSIQAFSSRRSKALDANTRNSRPPPPVAGQLGDAARPSSGAVLTAWELRTDLLTPIQPQPERKRTEMPISGSPPL